MDAKVNDFFKEINQISKSDPKEGEVWQECYDELTGYSYFWNVETDDVTWVPPKSYKPAENVPNKRASSKTPAEQEKKKGELFLPPRTVTPTQHLPLSVKPEAKSKVYSVQETVKQSERKREVKNHSNRRPQPPKTSFRKPSDSDDEKIELITEYGGDSDSDDGESLQKIEEIKKRLGQVPSSVKKPPAPVAAESNLQPIKQNLVHSDNDEEEDEDDDIDLLAKIQKRAQELKQMGGEVPPSVKNIIHNSELKGKIDNTKSVSGFSLVAGYNSDSSDSDSERRIPPPPKAVFPVAPPPKPIPETSHSTLFPITKPIDVKDFIGPEPLPVETVKPADDTLPLNNDFDSKAFQRKRRIGISLVNNSKRPKEDLEIDNPEHKGFGFVSESVKNGEDNVEKTVYPAFHKGGVMFVKSDVLIPSIPPEHKKVNTVDQINSEADRKKTEDDYTVLREKLLFLGEGRDPVLPVQVMLIQAETLFTAMEDGGLKLSYLHKWLKETCSDLVKLEKEAAPEGWLLQWDRSHKRYFYQNQITGVSQWRYPEPDVTRCDDAMDISTTPPPPPLPMDDSERVMSPISPVVFGPQLPLEPPLPPSPPKIRSPTPPPPPVISVDMSKVNIPDVPLPPQPPQLEVKKSQSPSLDNGQPLPPGVDMVSDYKLKETEAKVPDTLSNALDSFYSEIAEVVTETPSAVSFQAPEQPIDDSMAPPSLEVTKKKKKKVKLAQGLTMKQKGVSQLVAKWKSVQKSYED